MELVDHVTHSSTQIGHQLDGLVTVAPIVGALVGTLTEIRHQCDANLSPIRRTLDGFPAGVPPDGGQLPDSLVVFADQSCPDQERLDDLADGATRQRQAGRQDVQPVRAFGQDAEVLLFVRARGRDRRCVPVRTPSANGRR